MNKATKISLILLLSLTVLLITPIATFLFITRDCVLDESKLIGNEQNVLFLDKNGEKMETLSLSEHKIHTPLSLLKEETKQAFLSIEDKRFYEHGGINLKRMAKAAMENVKSGSFRQGASTISQQLIKNTHLTGEKTIKRKLKEIRLTFMLERTYSKDEILELYLNTVYFGHSIYGIGNASKYYFDKTPDRLTIAESAMLAGLLQSPNRYSPFKYPEKCLARRNLVLSEMEKDEVMSDIITTAKGEPLPEKPTICEENAYLELVFEELDELIESNSIQAEKLVVTTGYDPNIQGLLGYDADSDAILCVAENDTGLLAGYHSTVGKIKRLPGSVIKPLLVYAPAIEQDHVVPMTPVLDEKTDFSDYSPSNYGDVYRGYISAKEAFAVSSNVVAVKLLNEIGVETGKSFLDKMNLQTEENSLALALGAMKEGFTLHDIVSAYSVFSRHGMFIPFTTIGKIERDGKQIYEKKRSGNRIFSEETIDLTNEMLNYTTKEGTAKKLSSLPFETYAKTGTVGGKNGNTDAYAVTLTEKHTIGIWLGNADYSPIKETGGSVPIEETKKILEGIYREKYPSSISESGKIKTVELDKMAYEKQKMEIADANSPKNERIKARFKMGKEPKIISQYFSNPTISPPSITYCDGKIEIDLPDMKYYSYRIERASIHEYTILYNNIQSTKVIDLDIIPDTTYLYTVTPLCFGRQGTPILLSMIHTDAEKKEIPTNPPIVDKEWWNE
ncbi:MAG: transglycosylase domain-containing protein [Clostridia bacterium]|nr:transglycosylase domain-containing protein [Clostridia bacterium]